MCRFNAITIKILARKKKILASYFVDINKLILKFMKRPRIAKNIEDEQIQKTDTTQLQYLL